MDDRTVTGRVLAVLDAVADQNDPATLAALTRRTGIPKPTVRRIAADLVRRRLLERHGATYRLGPRLWEFGARDARHHRLHLAAVPHVQELYARTGEVAWILASTGTHNALLHAAFGTNRAADMQRPWPTAIRSAGFLTTAAGRVLLADRPELTELLRSRPLPRLTPYTATTWATVAAAIDATRDHGVSIEHEQSSLGYDCIAAGVRAGAEGHAVGVVGVLGRTGSFVAERLTRPILAAAAGIERELRRGPHPDSRPRPAVPGHDSWH